MKLPKLHNQILIALILGAIFGSIFNVSRTSLKIIHKKNNEIITSSIKDWERFSIISYGQVRDSILFKAHQQIEILNYFKKIQAKEKNIFIILEKFYSEENDELINLKLIENVISIEREKTIATQIKWLGDIFIRLLNMIAIPLVLASLLVGAASLGDIKKFARIGGKTLSFYLITTAIAVAIGLICANIIKPGEKMQVETKDEITLLSMVKMLKKN